MLFRCPSFDCLFCCRSPTPDAQSVCHAICLLLMPRSIILITPGRHDAARDKPVMTPPFFRRHARLLLFRRAMAPHSAARDYSTVAPILCYKNDDVSFSFARYFRFYADMLAPAQPAEPSSSAPDIFPDATRRHVCHLCHCAAMPLTRRRAAAIEISAHFVLFSTLRRSIRCKHAGQVQRRKIATAPHRHARHVTTPDAWKATQKISQAHSTRQCQATGTPPLVFEVRANVDFDADEPRWGKSSDAAMRLRYNPPEPPTDSRRADTRCPCVCRRRDHDKTLCLPLLLFDTNDNMPTR